MRYRHNPDIDIQATKDEIRRLEFDRNLAERYIDDLGISRFTEPKIDALRAEVRDLDRRIDGLKAELDAHLNAKHIAAEAALGPAQLSLFSTSAKGNPARRYCKVNPSCLY
jgi:hypothetical protein